MHSFHSAGLETTQQPVTNFVLNGCVQFLIPVYAIRIIRPSVPSCVSQLGLSEKVMNEDNADLGETIKKKVNFINFEY
jgi:hypothetical protein